MGTKVEVSAEEHEGHLFALATECMARLVVDEDFGYGLTMDCNGPFGNLGYHGVLRMTLDMVGALYEIDENGNVSSDWLEYAQSLWTALPKFLRERVDLRRRPKKVTKA